MYKQHDNQHLPCNYYTFTSQLLYIYPAKGIQLQRKRYTVATQKVYSCNAKGIQLQQRSNAFTTRQIFKGSSDDFERLEGNQ